MRFFILLLFAICVSAKINPKALTESRGQEVIEIGAPIKELSPDLEEEPSAENEDDKTTTTIQVATTKDTRRAKSDQSKRTKDSDRVDGKKQDEEEAKIEKELAELYRDSIDYKSESADITQQANVTEETEKPIARARTNFKFQPDSSDPKDVERFRTSVDDINCDRVKLIGVTHGHLKTETIDLEDEKEIGLYGDRNDYKTASDVEGNTYNTTIKVSQDVARARTRKKKSKTKRVWKFQPDPNDPADIARFRTSQDYLNCDMFKLTGTMATEPNVKNEDNNSCGTSKKFIPLLLLCIIVYI